MKKTLEVLNSLKDKELIDAYAIGGGVATIFYTEPVFTYDLDVFIVVKPESEGEIISLASIYDHLTGKGCSWNGEHIMIEGFPVQFIPVTTFGKFLWVHIYKLTIILIICAIGAALCFKKYMKISRQ